MSNDFVKQGYNKVAENYSSSRDQFKNKKYLDKLIKHLKPKSTVLDIGCGAGKPIDGYLIENGYKVIGIDISEKQIELARRNLPEATFNIKDMSELAANDYSVDAVISFYAIFHTPRESHQDLFNKISTYLQKDGLLLITMGSTEWEGTEDFHGTDMFWSHYDAKQNTELVTNAGFEIVSDEIDTSGGEKHQVILARKK